MSHLCSEQKIVADRSGHRHKRNIGLIKNIPSFGGVVVAGDGDKVFICRDSAWHVVFIEAIVIAKHGAVADVEATRLVIDVSRSEIYANLGPTVIRVSEESLDGNVYR